jgi:hypothetical protein
MNYPELYAQAIGRKPTAQEPIEPRGEQIVLDTELREWQQHRCTKELIKHLQSVREGLYSWCLSNTGHQLIHVRLEQIKQIEGIIDYARRKTTSSPD